MPTSDIRKPSERNKVIGAVVLGLLAVILLWWTFIGFGSSPKATSPRATRTPTPAPVSRATSRTQPAQPVESMEDILDTIRPVNINFSQPPVPEARRNIFVYYEPPPKPTPKEFVPTPTPTPEPPALLANLSPASVYARTGDFTLEIAGDKFTPQMRVVMDNNELPTRFKGPQQVSATVPAAMIATPGGREVMLRSTDGKLYTNTATLSIADPPKPNYTYIGIIGSPRHIDIAILQDKSNKEVLNIQRGDLLGGRFRLTSISEKELVLIDNNLKIKHTLPFSAQGDRSNPLQRPTPRVESEDDEP